MGVRPTAEAKSRLSQWQRWEGGSTNNSASNNYMNTKMPMPGSFDAIGNGVQGYKTLAQGAIAFAKTLKARSDYSPLVDWIASGKGDPSNALQVWVAGPGGVGSSSAVGYAQKVLGSAGSSNGRTAGFEPVNGGSTPSPAVTAIPGATASNVGDIPPSDGAAAIRAQARQNLSQIASGQMKPTDALATIPQLVKTLHASIPKIANPFPAVAGSSAGSGSLEAQAVNLARKYIGVKYTWGGTTPDTGFDCSGLVQHVWGAMGVKIPRTTYEQWDAGKPVSADALQPGDEVFFTGSDPQNGKPGHEGLYIGEGKFIEAPGTGKEVRVSALAGRTDFVGARRFG